MENYMTPTLDMFAGHEAEKTKEAKANAFQIVGHVPSQ
jgi:hypothetical protein